MILMMMLINMMMMRVVMVMVVIPLVIGSKFWLKSKKVQMSQSFKG